jgi:integrase
VLIGSAEAVTVEQARAKAKTILAEVALGRDPQADKLERRGKDAHTLRTTIDGFLTAKNGRRPRTLFELKRYLAGPLYLKSLHAMPVDHITRRDVAACLLAVTRDRGPVPAARLRAALSAVYSWAIGMGLADFNPVTGTAKPEQPPSRDRVLSDDELVAIWKDCNDDDAGRIIRLLILTGARRSEVGGMRWSEVERHRALWTIPAARSKNGRQHDLPLSSAAMRVIEPVPQRADRDHLFGERASLGFTTWGKSKNELDARLGEKVKPWTYHDLRRSCATKMADIGVAPHIIEAVLNHVSGHKAGVAGIYNRATYAAEKRAALERWAEHVAALVEGRATNIVPLRKTN